MDREKLISTLNQLTRVELNNLILSVGMPASEQLGSDAQHGLQVVKLLQWAESLNGCGLDRIKYLNESNLIF